MKKIISLFCRDHEGTRQVYDEVVPGAEWVANGEGVDTIKYDGSPCMVRNGVLFKRYNRRLFKPANKRKKRDASFIPTIEDFKPAPEGWEAAEEAPNIHTGHWPGWVAVGDGPEDQYHREAYSGTSLSDGTYELIGPRVQNNPYRLTRHYLIGHNHRYTAMGHAEEPPRTFEGLQEFFRTAEIEGIVWHHPDGRMVKIKRKDFGFPWPVKK